MAKKILFHEEARTALKRGIDTVANAVRITMGPRGRNVILDKGFGAPMITNDGVSIAKDITLSDKFENMGAEIIKEVASKTNDAVGDGTTTSVVLTQAIIEDGFKRISMGVNPIIARKGIEDAAKDAVTELQKMSQKIKGDHEKVVQVATISAESEEIGKIVAETIGKVGENGVVTVEESQSFGVESEVVEGLEFDKGYISHYMVTNGERMEAVYEDSAIFVTDKKISTVKEILPLLEKLAQTGKKELVIIADDVDGEALTTFVLNKLRGGFNVLAIKAPGFGDRKKDFLQDIAITIGATVISEELGIKLEQVDLSHLGRARKLIATKDSTVIVGGKGKKGDIDARIAKLKVQKEAADGKYDKEKFEERIAKLSGGVAVIRVGAATETEMKYLKLKIEDAVNATKAAIEEGIVAGGGIALAKASFVLSEKLKTSADFKKWATHPASADYIAGYSSVIAALLAPLKQIIANAAVPPEIPVLAEVMNSKDGKASWKGFDARDQVMVTDMFKAGIVDPLKVERTAIENAASAAAVFLTTEVAIAEEPKVEKELPTGGMGDMGY